MERRTISIGEEIEKQEVVVSAAKDWYEAELEKLAKLQKKKRELQGQELLKAFENSDRSLEEVLRFLQIEGDFACAEETESPKSWEAVDAEETEPPKLQEAADAEETENPKLQEAADAEEIESLKSQEVTLPAESIVPDAGSNNLLQAEETGEQKSQEVARVSGQSDLPQAGETEFPKPQEAALPAESIALAAGSNNLPQAEETGKQKSQEVVPTAGSNNLPQAEETESSKPQEAALPSGSSNLLQAEGIEGQKSQEAAEAELPKLQEAVDAEEAESPKSQKTDKKKVWIGVVAVVAVLTLVILYSWTFVLGGRAFKTETIAAVDGRISYNADEEIEKAMQDVSAGCAEADIVCSDPSQEEKTVALAFYALSDSAVNDEILRLLEDNGYQATFCVTGVEAADNEDFVQNLISKGNDAGSYGLKGISQAEDKTQEDLVKSFAHSQKVLTMLTDRAAKLLYCSDTTYTSAVRQAAYASGYEKVISTEAENTLDYRTFESQQEVRNYVSGLTPGALLMIRIDGKNEVIPDEPIVEPDVPAIDKQPDADISETEAETEEENALQLTKWLLEAMKAQDMKTVRVDSLSSLEDSRQEQEEGEKKALIYRSFLTGQNEVALALWNLPDSGTMEEIKALLRQYGAKATLFVTEEELAQRMDDLKALAQDGFPLGNGGSNIADCEKLLGYAAAEKLMAWLPISHLPLGGIYEEDGIRKLAAAEGYVIVAPETPKQPQAGAFYGFDLSQPDAAKQLEALLQELQNSSLAVRGVGQLMKDFGQIPSFTSAQMEALRTQNDGKREQAVGYVHTTERALSFLFYGVSNQPVMRDICSRLSTHRASATFFATLNEMQQNGELIEKLLSEGHEIGIAYVENTDYPADFDSVVRYLNSCVQYFQWRYDGKLQTVFLPYGEANPEVEEAVSAMGLSLAGHNIAVVKSSRKDLTVDGIPEVFETDLAKVNITRGSQVYFNADFYAADQDLTDSDSTESVCGAMVDAVFTNFIDPIAYQDPATGQIAEESRYQVKTCSAVRSSEQCYTLTANVENCEIKESNSVVTGLEAEEEQMDYIAEHYIGTPSADTSAELPGFNRSELKQLDKMGRFTKEPVLFLTFDDWGTDVPINHLLYVLEKYNIKATFYVRANYVGNNPNLLRAIAEAGHEISSHSYGHLPLAEYVEKSGSYISLTDEAAAELRADVVKSYRELYTYIGDVNVDGLASLSRNFRPPTLAASKIGLTEVLDVGFDYIVSGDFSTHDYEAASVDELLDKFRRGIQTWRGRQKMTNGSILVMHMSDEAQYTAQALDQMIPTWKEQGYSFERVDVGISQALSARTAAEDES